MSINKAFEKFCPAVATTLMIILAACNPGTNQDTLEHDHDHTPVATSQQGAMGMEVALSTEQIGNIGLTYTAITPQKIRSMVRLTGRVELPPAGKAIAGSNLEGKVVAVHVMAGSLVRKGQQLFTIQNLQIIDWQQDLKMKQAELEYLIKDLERQEQLVSENIAPAKNYEMALSKKNQQEAAIEALSARLAAIGIQAGEKIHSTFTVLAPMTGFVQHLLVSNGQFINASTPLAEIISNEHLHLHLVAYGADVMYLAKDQVLNFFVQSRPDRIQEARILWINAMVDETDNSYDIHAEILGDYGPLTAGEFVEARVINQEDVLNTLPLGAVTLDKGLYYIFVRQDEHDGQVHFRKVQVQTGESDLGYIEIKPVDPLPAVGDSSIVDNGSFFLMAESRKGEEEAGHDH